MHAAALFVALGDERARKFFEGFLENGAHGLLNGEVRRRVAAPLRGSPTPTTRTSRGSRVIQWASCIRSRGIGTRDPERRGADRRCPHPEGRRFVDCCHRRSSWPRAGRADALRPGVTPPDGVPAIGSRSDERRVLRARSG
jgi:hypothetical protein